MDRWINAWTVKILCFKERYTHTPLRKRLTLKTYWTWKVKKKSISILKTTDTGMIPFWPHKFFQVETDLLFAFYCCCNKLPQIEWLNQHSFFIRQFWKSEVPKRSAGLYFPEAVHIPWLVTLHDSNLCFQFTSLWLWSFFLPYIIVMILVITLDPVV